MGAGTAAPPEANPTGGDAGNGGGSPAPAASESGSSTPRQNRKRTYVVIEKLPGTEGIKVVAKDIEAGTSDDACWDAVEKKDSELNKRAKGEKGEKPPKLLAIPTSAFEFKDYPLEIQTKVVRARGK